MAAVVCPKDFTVRTSSLYTAMEGTFRWILSPWHLRRLITTPTFQCPRMFYHQNNLSMNIIVLYTVPNNASILVQSLSRNTSFVGNTLNVKCFFVFLVSVEIQVEVTPPKSRYLFSTVRAITEIPFNCSVHIRQRLTFLHICFIDRPWSPPATGHRLYATNMLLSHYCIC